MGKYELAMGTWFRRTMEPEQTNSRRTLDPRCEGEGQQFDLEEQVGLRSIVDGGQEVRLPRSAAVKQTQPAGWTDARLGWRRLWGLSVRLDISHYCVLSLCGPSITATASNEEKFDKGEVVVLAKGWLLSCGEQSLRFPTRTSGHMHLAQPDYGHISSIEWVAVARTARRWRRPGLRPGRRALCALPVIQIVEEPYT